MEIHVITYTFPTAEAAYAAHKAISDINAKILYMGKVVHAPTEQEMLFLGRTIGLGLYRSINNQMANNHGTNSQTPTETSTQAH